MDQRDYVKAVQRLLSQYSRYIYLKLDDDDSMLAKSLTGYPGELGEVKCGSMEEQIKQWENMMFNTPQSRAGQKIIPQFKRFTLQYILLKFASKFSRCRQAISAGYRGG